MAKPMAAAAAALSGTEGFEERSRVLTGDLGALAERLALLWREIDALREDALREEADVIDLTDHASQ